MRQLKIADLELTVGDIVEWQDPDTLIFHKGFITPYGHPFAGYTYVVVSETAPIMDATELNQKLRVTKIDEL